MLQNNLKKRDLVDIIANGSGEPGEPSYPNYFQLTKFLI